MEREKKKEGEKQEFKNMEAKTGNTEHMKRYINVSALYIVH